jgi:integrase
VSKINFTSARVAAFRCPVDQGQAFHWDTEVPGLSVRVTPRGKPAYVFQRQHLGRTVRITIGGVGAWSIPEARHKAREIQRQLDVGDNPVELKRAKRAAQESERSQREVESITVGQIWPTYLERGRPKGKDAFRPRYLADLKLMSSAGGERKKRGAGSTLAGPIHPLLAVPLVQLDEDRLLAWYKYQEVRGRPQAARALMMFRGFLRWCLSQTEHRILARPAYEAARSPALVGELPAQKRRTDSVEPSQVACWWEEVLQLPNVQVSAYLRALLMTGLRREAMATLKWRDVDLRWKRATFTDKVFGTRSIPLGDDLCRLIADLPKQNEYVFSGKGEPGHVKDPRASMTRALKQAGLGHVSIHGLRRSFALLAEDSGIPVGAAAQYMGHAPGGTHEGYKPRSQDQLRVYINRVERHLSVLLASPQSDGGNSNSSGSIDAGNPRIE